MIQQIKNYLFSLLPVKMRRILILKDAVALLQSRKIVANTGNVFITDHGYPSESEQLQTWLKRILRKTSDEACTVCARGALLCSTVLRENSFTGQELDATFGRALTDFDGNLYNEPADKRLAKLFEPKQLAMFETAFERQHNYTFLGIELHSACVRFGSRYDNTNDRAIAIFENAIRNGGEFDPYTR